MKLFVFRPSMNVQRQGRVFEPGGSGGEPPFDSLSNHHSGHQQQQQHHPIYNNSRHAAGEDDPLQVYLKNGIVQSSKTAVFNLQKRQFKIIKNGSFQLSKMALKNISVRKKTSSRRCKNTSFSLLTNADEKLNISCKNVVEMSDIVACFQNPRPPENRVDVTKETRENNYFPYTVHTFPPHIFFIFLYFFNLS